MTNPPAPDSAPPVLVPRPTLWAEGRFTLRVRGPGGEDRVVAVGRPYGLIGRVAGADLIIDDPAVSGRHVYLHLDRRGLFAVDLATRSGTRVGDAGGPAGWLVAGEALEVAGRRVELGGCVVDGVEPAPGEAGDPLAEAGADELMRVTLYPAREPDAPMALGSELVFLGRSPSCGVRVDGESATRTHCVLVRTRGGAYLVDLAGRGTWLNQRPLRGAAALADGDALMVGSARFDVRVEPPGGRAHETLPVEVIPNVAGLPAKWLAGGLPALPADVVPAEAQPAVLAWMMGILQAGQGEILRQQAEFQRSMAAMVRQLHLDNAAILSRHLERVEAINRELAALREEVRRRFGAADAPRAGPALPPVPATPLRVSPAAPPDDPAAATSWLLDRVRKLEQENRSTWRDLLSRLGQAPRPSD